MKKYFLILGVFLLLALIVVSFISPLFKKTQKPRDLIQFQSPTPTTQPSITITSAYPSPNSTNISLFPKIQVNFSRSLTETEKNTTSITILPDITGSTNWSSDNKILSLDLPKPLNPNQKYIAKLIYLGLTHSWTFTTVPVEKATSQDQTKLQLQADQQVAEQRDQFIQKYPWFLSLPLEEKEYFVYFTTNQGDPHFIGKLYPQTSSSTSINDQIANMQNEIKTRLTNLGIDLSVYNITWEIKPE